MDDDTRRARTLIEESREAVIVLDESDTVLLASRRARQTIDGIDEALVRAGVESALDAAGYPRRADPARIRHVRVVAILFVLLAFVAMVYGPIAAMLVEMFPTRLRCSSVSLPYHLGNGWFGGLLPSAVLAISARGGHFTAGLWLPIAVALAGAVVGLLWLRETKDTVL